jgi:hypothetical protein
VGVEMDGDADFLFQGVDEVVARPFSQAPSPSRCSS